MFLSGKALLIYKAKQVASIIQAIIIIAITIIIIGSLMITL